MAKSASKAGADGPIIIKKYANRRLYNTASSKYITLDFLAELTRKEIEFQVLDAKTNEDITHNVLTQIIMDEESTGQGMLPVGFLRQLIAMYGGSLHNSVPDFLESSIKSFKDSQKQVESVIETAITSGPFGDIAKKNIEFARAARDALMPNLSDLTGMAGKKSKSGSSESENIDDLKRQIAELQAKIDNLSA